MREEVVTQVPGIVWKVFAKPGDAVKPGDVLFILEVMKLEVPHASNVEGIVQAVHVAEGQEVVDAGIIAVVIA